MSEAFWRCIYNGIGVPAMWAAFRVGALFDEKTRDALHGRRGWVEDLSRQLGAARSEPVETLWFHAPSVGEFEQAKPLMSALHPDYRIVATCFSPSVIGAMRRYPFKDAALYIPLDSRRNMRRMFDMIAPKAVVFSKFDVWPNAVWEASRRGIPTALIAGTMHAESRRRRPVGRNFLRHVHKHLTAQCAVSEEDAARLRDVSGGTITVTGDTRFDSVYIRAQNSPETALFPDTWNGKFVLVAGSTYDADERVLIPAFVRLKEHSPDARLILVPHEPTPQHLAASESALSGFRVKRLSAVDDGASIEGVDVVLVDRVGVLAHLYRYGTTAFVGGSFHMRIHNVMEPAALGKPVLMGPLMTNAGEAFGLLDVGAAIKVGDAG
ncbi:MAG: hypothetical protein O3A46_12420, partial [Candidatus Poribacteria bacterium]|nr:hypothetical protein [Candidatus Poribacteria bacterium]